MTKKEIATALKALPIQPDGYNSAANTINGHRVCCRIVSGRRVYQTSERTLWTIRRAVDAIAQKGGAL